MKKKWTTICAIGLCIIAVFSVRRETFSAPGAEDDPLVTKSYVEKRIEQIKYYIDQKIGNQNTEVVSTSELEVVEVESGQSLIGTAGTEIILRGGKGQVIAGELGGLSDITGGKDLKMGEMVPANHLMIVPRNDRRGVFVTEKAIFMIRGAYQIQ